MQNELVAVTDQAGAQILVFDQNALHINDPKACVWQWQPKEADGFFDCERYTNSSDVRLRRFRNETVLLTCASGGFAAVISYPSGKSAWCLKHSQLVNPHAIEILPNGLIFIADSQGNSITGYHYDDPSSEILCKVEFEDAHGLLWDPENEILWALCGKILTGFRVEGDDKHPCLTEIPQLHCILPTINGHDLQPVFNDSDRLWLTTGFDIYQFDKTAKRFITDYPGAEQIRCTGAKSIGNQPESGIVVRAVPNGTMYAWNTNSIDYFFPSNQGYNHVTVSHATGAFYKARVLCERYL